MLAFCKYLLFILMSIAIYKSVCICTLRCTPYSKINNSPNQVLMTSLLTHMRSWVLTPELARKLQILNSRDLDRCQLSPGMEDHNGELWLSWL